MPRRGRPPRAARVRSRARGEGRASPPAQSGRREGLRGEAAGTRAEPLGAARLRRRRDARRRRARRARGGRRPVAPVSGLFTRVRRDRAKRAAADGARDDARASGAAPSALAARRAPRAPGRPRAAARRGASSGPRTAWRRRERRLDGDRSSASSRSEPERVEARLPATKVEGPRAHGALALAQLPAARVLRKRRAPCVVPVPAPLPLLAPRAAARRRRRWSMAPHSRAPSRDASFRGLALRARCAPGGRARAASSSASNDRRLPGDSGERARRARRAHPRSARALRRAHPRRARPFCCGERRAHRGLARRGAPEQPSSRGPARRSRITPSCRRRFASSAPSFAR